MGTCNDYDDMAPGLQEYTPEPEMDTIPPAAIHKVTDYAELADDFTDVLAG